MKNNLFLTLILIILPVILFAQTPQQIREEAYPTYQNLTDNSEYAILWGKVIEARKTGNTELYNNLTAEINSKFPEKYIKTINEGNEVVFGQPEKSPPFMPETPDWGPGDALVRLDGLSNPTPDNPRPFDRMVRVMGDTTNRLFAVYISTTRDTLNILRSTNDGLSWTRIQLIRFASPTLKFHSVDMFLTDSTNSIRLGIAFSAVSSTGSGQDGIIYWATMNENGSSPRIVPIRNKETGRGFISPAIISDGYVWSPGLTYWYIVYRNVDSATGVGNTALIQWSTNWGYSWGLDTARASFNDYDLDVDYSFNADTIFVLLTNNLTTSNPNLRLRYVQLGGLGTSAAWKQFNPATTSDPEFGGSLSSSRQDNSIAVTYTRTTGGVDNVFYSYTTNGTFPWTSNVPITSGINNENLSSVECNEKQGVYRLAYHSAGTSFDTIVYMNTASLPSGFGSRVVVNATNSAKNNIAPDIASLNIAGGVIFPNSQNTRILYDASGITPTGIVKNTEIPDKFSLLQNYPNPFNPVTYIKFTIPNNLFVTLSVFDLTGKEVARLINGELNPGSYTLDFDASKLSSGVYFYKLTAGEYSDIKKMMLIK